MGLPRRPQRQEPVLVIKAATGFGGDQAFFGTLRKL
jgi:hypothetical protein